MIAPVLMYERYEAYGLKYSQPVAFILVVVSLLVFIALRFVTAGKTGNTEERS
jgi:molybdate/tungstate transport system permease protein